MTAGHGGTCVVGDCPSGELQLQLAGQTLAAAGSGTYLADAGSHSQPAAAQLPRRRESSGTRHAVHQLM